MTYSNASIDIKELIESGYIVILDTNVYLGLYRCSPDYADFAFKCLNAIKDSIAVPSVVDLEFKKHHFPLYKNRQKSIETSIEDSLKLVGNQKQKILNSCGVLETRNFPEIDVLLSEIANKYDAVENLMHDYFDEHSVLSFINDTWTTDLPQEFVETLRKSGQVMKSLPLGNVYAICDDGEKRYKKRIPPGYKDASSKDGVRKYSDLIIWNEIIAYSRQQRKNIIIVTDDVKEDWWTNENGQYAFREELISEFEKETEVRAGSPLGMELAKNGGTMDGMKVVPFISSDFYKAVATSYQIPQVDAIGVALALSDNDYIDNIKDSVFDEIVTRLSYSSDEFLDGSMSHVGTEGIDEWEIDDYDYMDFEVTERDGNTIIYRLHFHVEMSGTSYDYWGRDDDTKEVIRSDPFDHEVAGDVYILVRREVDMLTDFECDDEFASAELDDASFSEVSYKDHAEDSYYDDPPDAYMECGKCGCKINSENDAGNGWCTKCTQEEE